VSKIEAAAESFRELQRAESEYEAKCRAAFPVGSRISYKHGANVIHVRVVGVNRHPRLLVFNDATHKQYDVSVWSVLDCMTDLFRNGRTEATP